MVLDRAIMELVKIDPEQPLEVSTDDGKRLIIKPVTDPKRRKKFREALDWTKKTHAKTLKKLAE